MIRKRQLRKILTYNPKTGEFIGGGKINIVSRGYLRMRIDKKDYMLQQLAWIYMNGTIPEGYKIGFKDKNNKNLKFDNLHLKGSKVVFKDGEYKVS